MSITFDNSAKKDFAAATTYDINFTCTSHAVIVVFSYVNGSVASLSAVEYGGTPLSLLGGVNTTTSRLEVWAATAPPSGALTLSAVVVGSTALSRGFTILSYTGAADASTFRSPTTGTAGAATDANFNVNSTPTEVVACAFALLGSGVITPYGCTGRASATGTSALVAADTTGAATLSLSASSSVSRSWLFLGLPIVGTVSSAVVFTPSMGLLGAGF